MTTSDTAAPVVGMTGVTIDLPGVRALAVRPAASGTPVRDLSGGNQRKALRARRLVTDPRLLVLDEPARGVGIGAGARIQEPVPGPAGKGLSVLHTSTRPEEGLRRGDRTAVRRDRRRGAELAAAAVVIGGTLLPGGARVRLAAGRPRPRRGPGLHPFRGDFEPLVDQNRHRGAAGVRRPPAPHRPRASMRPQTADERKETRA